MSCKSWSMLSLIVFMLFCVLPGTGISAEATGGEYGDYIGWMKCRSCHEQLAAGWQMTRHAWAFGDLKKSGQEGLPDCQRCHVIGYGEEGGFIDSDLTPELVNVQCEECHGAGRAHASDPGKKGSIIAKPSEQKCLKCHTPGQDKSFNYALKIKEIHGPKQ